MLVELKNGETLNGHLVNCDTWMNLTLKEVVQTSPVRRRRGASHHLDLHCLIGRLTELLLALGRRQIHTVTGSIREGEQRTSDQLFATPSFGVPGS